MHRRSVRSMIKADFPILFVAPAWRPAVDVYRNDSGWLIKMDLAGVRPSDVQLALTKRGLLVRGRRCDRAIDSSWRRHHLEIAYSTFERLVELPPLHAAIDAELMDGMLLVRLRERVQRR
jgi:HSP20 family protein